MFIKTIHKSGIQTFGLLLVLCFLASNDWFSRLCKKAEEKWSGFSYLRLVWMAVLLIASMAFLVNATYNPFLYYRF